MASDLQLYQRLDTELVTFLENFTNLVKAARISDEDVELVAQRQKRVPSDLLEVLAEKTVSSAQICLNCVSELKRGAILSDFAALIESIRQMRNMLSKECEEIDEQLGRMKGEARELLRTLETHYYQSSEKGSIPDLTSAQELRELCRLALRDPCPN